MLIKLLTKCLTCNLINKMVIAPWSNIISFYYSSTVPTNHIPSPATILDTDGKIVEYFLYPLINPIVGPPTYNYLSECLTKISSNAAFMQTNMGGRALGFLVSVVNTTVYSTLLDNSFTAPVNPGTSPHIPSRATGIKQTAIH